MSEKKHKRSKEEIAKQFDLPERKSKIKTILKHDDEAYCICRSSDCSRFMICCDYCEEWYHGDCISISSEEAKHIKQYYCLKCRQEDQSLQIVFRAVPAPSVPKQPGGPDLPDKKPKPPKKERVVASSTKRCGTCSGCTSPKCNICEACLSRSTGKKGRCEMRVCVGQNSASQHTAIRPKRRRSPSPEVLINPELEGQRQCYGPACKMTARPQSKYCCDDCGIKLATSRIYQVLPQRIQEWNLSPCMAEEKNKQQLDGIRKKQVLVRSTLQELDRRNAELDAIVERARHSTIDPKALESVDVEEEMSMYCITCGHEIHSKTAIRHMEKCFNKYESQASFGSIFKTRIEGGGSSMFCDYYNSASKTYCKRLRVLCPEHCKDPKVNDSDICGCPLVTNVFQLTGEYCRAPKKNCFRHYVWEKIRRAEIDLERVRQWLKLDELVEQERQIRSAMASRAGVLSLMLHSTFNHSVMEKLKGLKPGA